MVYQSVKSKANSKDVTEGFKNIKKHYDGIITDKKLDYITRSEIGAIIRK